MRKDTTHNLTVAAMLSAVAFILMFIEFPVPMLIPSFVKMDFSDLPALLGAFALGPVYGVVISFMKNLSTSSSRVPALPVSVSCATLCWALSSPLWRASSTSIIRAARPPSSAR